MFICTIILAILAIPAHAQDQCRLYLANQTDGNSGLTLTLESPADSNGNCSPNSLSVHLAVGEGAGLQDAVDAALPWQSWQNGAVVFTATAVITKAGPQELLINGQPALPAAGQFNFQPAKETFFGSLLANSGTPKEQYIVTPISLSVTNGSNSRSVAPNGTNPLPFPLTLLPGGPAPWLFPFTEDAAQPTTITATFELDPPVADPHQFDPYIDKYGQANAANWPGKISSDSELLATVTQEQAWLAANGPIPGLDQYGGSTVARWEPPPVATNYYYTTYHNNRWYLISPLGNPVFYIGMTAVQLYATPITGREAMFQLPTDCNLVDSRATCDDAYQVNVNNDPPPQPTPTYVSVSYSTANNIRKYGSNWQTTRDALMHQRFKSWGFAGGGKFGNFPSDMPVTPILAHNGFTGVSPAVPLGHPDVFDPAVVNQMTVSLCREMMELTGQGSQSSLCNGFRTNPQSPPLLSFPGPNIVGWSVGNESEEIITTAEVQAILALGASSPAKTALVHKALTEIYGGYVPALAKNWQITASTEADIDAANPCMTTTRSVKLCPGAADLEPLRIYYEQTYFSNLYNIIKKQLDPNHLYFGIWAVAGDTKDWSIVSANCDVVGFDDFSPGPLTRKLRAEFASADKPVMLGAWGVPSDYEGARGFGWDQYTRLMTLSDSDSGDAYIKRMRSLAVNKYVVGSMIFDYQDEPLTGRGNTDGTGNITDKLVVAENFAFGMVDVTDTPKYDLVNKVRAANIKTLLSLGLLADTTPPVTTATVAGTRGSDGWYLGPTDIDFTATDDLTGVARTEFSLDDGSTWKTGNSHTFKTDGIHTILYRSIDHVGNVETPKSVTVMIDSTAPSTTVSTHYRTLNGVPIVLEVDFLAIDNTSGVAKTEYSLDHGSTWITGKTFFLSASGTYTVWYRSTDVAGNVEPNKSVRLRVTVGP